MSPALRKAELGFEGPAVCAEIYQLRWVVLTRPRHQPETDPQNGLLLPFSEFGKVHSRAPYQVHRESESSRQEAGAIRECLRADNGASEIPNAIGKGSRKVGGAAPNV